MKKEQPYLQLQLFAGEKIPKSELEESKFWQSEKTWQEELAEHLNKKTKTNQDGTTKHYTNRKRKN